ncbi:MAG: T9SS type A sorting domain-containing protein [Ignavibacteria bacterium]|nr:T9SS type A sorting domain-containing protein [Ignavibacteria bacterium]
MKKQFITTFIVLLNILFCFEIRAQDIRNNLNIISPGNSNYIHQNTENNNTWISVQTPSLTRYITDVFFIDSLYGWASHAGVGIGIFKTTNSGYSWDSVRFSPVGDFLASIYFLDRLIGWTCGSAGKIRKTTDGGFNWINMDYSQNIGFYTINFEDSLNGIIAGINTNYKAIILKTINGGNNWSSIYNSITNFSSIREHFWLNKDTAWFGGYYTFLKTTNSGNSFVDMYQYIPPPYGVLGICFINNDTGWISGNDGNGHNIYKTTNGGYNWVFQNNPVSGFSFPQINDILFISPDTGWATSLVGYILKTTNGGDEWFIDNSSNTEFSKLALYKNKKIWCGADFGEIWYSHIEKTTGIQNNNSFVSDFNLYQNYPNPFNNSTQIGFDISRNNYYKLEIYNNLGQKVKEVFDKFLSAGSYKINFESGNISSGIYQYILSSPKERFVKSFVLVK